MHVTVLFLLLINILLVSGDEECSISRAPQSSRRLKKDLLCDYDKTLIPVSNHNDTVKVNVNLILKYLKYEHIEGTFTIDSWMTLRWTDAFLKWTPSDYDGIQSINLADTEIWMPDLSVYNRNDQSGDPSAVLSATCIISFPGHVTCVPPTRHESLCVGDLTRYPFDTQKCIVRYGSWVHSGEQINFTLSQSAVSTEEMVPNGEWEITEITATKDKGEYKCCPNNTYPSLIFSFQIRRLVGAHAASIVLPSLALTLITLTSLWMSPSNSDRLNVCCVNLICQFLYSQYVSWLVPMHGRNIPLIILFARDSLILSAFTIIFSIILKNLVSQQKPAPTWLSSLVSICISCRAGQYVFLDDSTERGIATAKGEDDAANIVQNAENKNNVQEWLVIAKVLDRICFSCYFIVYISMLIGFSP